MLKWRKARIATFVCVLAFMVGCSPQSCTPATPTDTSPGSLDVRVAVVDVDETPSDGKVIVVMQFLQNGHAVEFNTGETVHCNGVAMPFNGLFFGYAERVPIQAVGGMYQFVYTRQAMNTTVDVTVPSRPAIQSPAAGAMVMRTANFSFTYAPGGGSSIRGGARSGNATKDLAGQPDNGMLGPVDITSLAAGPGAVFITREITTTPGGSGFHTLEVKYSTSADRSVIWN